MSAHDLLCIYVIYLALRGIYVFGTYLAVICEVVVSVGYILGDLRVSTALLGRWS